MLRRRISVHRNAVNVGGQIVVGTPKTHAERSVVFPRFLVEPLAGACEGKGRDGVMFPNRFGHYAAPPGVSTWFSGAVARCMAADDHVPQGDGSRSAAHRGVAGDQRRGQRRRWCNGCSGTLRRR